MVNEYRNCPSCGYRLTIKQRITVGANHGLSCPGCFKAVLIESKISRLAQWLLLFISLLSVVIFAPRLVDSTYDNMFWGSLIIWILSFSLLYFVKLRSKLFVVKV
jgi:DNA-directed RNA polymerase subunit RPC12/RpoP